MLQAEPKEVGTESSLLAGELRGSGPWYLFSTLLSYSQGACHTLHLASKAPFPHSKLPRDTYT